MTDIFIAEAGTEATVRSAATGDTAAFSRLAAEHHAAMVRVAYIICGDRDTGLDAAQAAWTRAWHGLRSLREPSHVRAWLLAITANEARKLVRGQRRFRVADISLDVASDMVTGRATSDPIGSLDALDLQRALRSLSPEDRSLLALRYVAELDSMAIGEQLGISASGVRSRLARVLARLRLDLSVPPELDR